MKNQFACLVFGIHAKIFVYISFMFYAFTIVYFSISRICFCSGYNNLQNFGLHTISEPSLELSLMFVSNRAHPMSLC